MKQVVVGTYLLDHLAVELVLREGDGAEFYLCPQKGNCPRIKVGAQGPWDQIVSRLLHELLEMQMELNCHRYHLCSDYSGSMDGVKFWMDHPQFTKVCHSVGICLSDALPDLAKAWNKKKVWHE